MKRTWTVGATLLVLALPTQPLAAADLPSAPVVKAPAAVSVFDWSGFYVGLHAGYGWGKKQWTANDIVAVTTSRDSGSVDGILGGIQLGYNWQVHSTLFGIEGDLSWADLTGTTCTALFTVSCDTEVNRLATVTARLGYVSDRTMLYVKGGAAWVHERHVLSRPGASGSFSDTRAGWTIGAGLEHAFAPNWSAKLEYNYMDFGDERLATTADLLTPGIVTVDLDQRLHVIKAGINYRFATGKAPVVAGY